MFIFLLNILVKRLLRNRSKKLIFAIKTFLSTMCLLVFLMYSLISLRNVSAFISRAKEENYLEHFKYIETNQELYNRIVLIEGYIQNRDEDVLILDSMATPINIPMNKYYKNYDMFNLGNFGTKGEEGIIEDLKAKENIMILIKKDRYSHNWQLPTKVIEYVKENFKLIDEIDLFDIYTR